MVIIINWKLYRSARGAGSDIGFLPLGDEEEGDEPHDRRYGPLESVAFADAIVAMAKRLGMTGRLTAKQVFDAARMRDKTAVAAVNAIGDHLARAVASVISVLDPEL